MSYRSAKFVSAILAGILAGANFTAFAGDAAGTPDTCLSGPKATVPAGGHWYYRIDQATKRHCWYVGEEKDKTAQAAPRGSSSAAAAPVSAPPQQNANARKSISDARAELPVQARIEEDGGPAGGRPLPAPAANADNGSRAISGDDDQRRSVVASRWPELSGNNASPVAAPATVAPAAKQRSNTTVAPVAAPAAISLAAADAASEKHFGSIQMLLVVVVGALSLAGLMGSAIYRFGGMGSNRRREVRGDRLGIWDLARDEPLPPAAAHDNPQGRIAAMTARLSRAAAS